jgi:hydrogenase maturation protein HypF
MTSGNLAEEPIARTRGEAIARLGGIADRLLLHDREIAAACDDSVARTVAGRPMVLRRSRGFVPRPVVLAPPVARTVLACGAQWKNTFCLAHGDRAVFGAHVGDLDRLETYEVYEAGIARLERFLDLRPEIVAHDLHAGYLSTAYARRRPEPAIAVQHHHAHVVAVAAEHGLAGPVLGLAYDGTGAGPDGTAWGGELLWAERDRYRRLATLHPVALAGGDLAIREVWRLALAALDDAFAGAPPLDRLELFRRVPPRRLAGVRRMLANDLHAPRAHGLGRWFDLVGALLLGRLESRYEGEVALALDLAADPGERDAYPLELDFAAAPWRLDLRPALVAIVDDLLAGVAVGRIAGRFHSTVAVGSAALVQAAQAECGDLPVMLAGGCFQNAHLAAATISALGPDARVFLPRDVPPGDGGIALGQAVIADAVAALGKESAPCV